MSAYEVINNIFHAKSAKNGGVVRRKVATIQKVANLQALTKEVSARGFHLIEVDDQYIVICGGGAITIHC